MLLCYINFQILDKLFKHRLRLEFKGCLQLFIVANQEHNRLQG